MGRNGQQGFSPSPRVFAGNKMLDSSSTYGHSTDSAQEQTVAPQNSCFVPVENSVDVHRVGLSIRLLAGRWRCQTACKPGSVDPKTGPDDHSSGTHLTMRLTRPTQAAGRERPSGPLAV